MSESSASEEEQIQQNDVASTSAALAPALATVLHSQSLEEKRKMVTPSNDAVGSASPKPVHSLSASDQTESPPKPDMHQEEERLKSFKNWIHPLISPKTLARNGLYYLGRKDDVRCAYCKLELRCAADDPVEEHRQWAPHCTFLKQLKDKSSLNLDANEAGRDECGPYTSSAHSPERLAANGDQGNSPSCQRAGRGEPSGPSTHSSQPHSASVWSYHFTSTSSANLPNPAHPNYASQDARLRSFKYWPRSMRQKPEDLVEAGFFYSGTGDRTRCYYCNIGISDWEPEDIPWKKHAQLLPKCPYVQLVKGREYIQKVVTETGAIPAEETAPVSNNKDTGSIISDDNDKNDKKMFEDSKLCKICYEGERNVCFVPCGHVVCCAKCALSTNKCPMCRRTFHNAVRLYFS